MTWALATIAALLIAYATVSRRLESLSVSGAMFFTTAVLLGTGARRPTLAFMAWFVPRGLASMVFAVSCSTTQSARTGRRCCSRSPPRLRSPSTRTASPRGR